MQIHEAALESVVSIEGDTGAFRLPGLLPKIVECTDDPKNHGDETEDKTRNDDPIWLEDKIIFSLYICRYQSSLSHRVKSSVRVARNR